MYRHRLTALPLLFTVYAVYCICTVKALCACALLSFFPHSLLPVDIKNAVKLEIEPHKS